MSFFSFSFHDWIYEENKCVVSRFSFPLSHDTVPLSTLSPRKWLPRAYPALFQAAFPVLFVARTESASYFECFLYLHNPHILLSGRKTVPALLSSSLGKRAFVYLFTARCSDWSVVSQLRADWSVEGVLLGNKTCGKNWLRKYLSTSFQRIKWIYNEIIISLTYSIARKVSDYEIINKDSFDLLIYIFTFVTLLHNELKQENGTLLFNNIQN